MPHRDPEARRAYRKAYYAAHREQQIAAALQWQAEHPERAAEARRTWYQANGLEAARRYREANRDRLNAANRAWYEANPEKKAADNRTQRLRRNFGLTVDEYEAMVAAQNGLCALCGNAETSRSRRGELMRLAVDHDHVTGSVRALLCHFCNTGVGSFFDDPALLRSAAEYVERFTGRCP